ncbi:response regulator [Lacihabitans sp. LS3-19]|uniref:response regulator n=1 Tax=Lacihabitans sp. LS3-19 TaxID=2487335 RepID=UPI0020CD240F|nr:response regulator [Lacihabitans sp. LS3-19]MCP9768940.1 response regulator [Lacihabitans sp. LS3-19]
MLIYLIDDDQEDQEIFEMALSETGLNVNLMCFTNGLEAVDVLKNSGEVPSFIFLDLNMPKLNGFECLQLMAKESLFSETKKIVYSTSSNEKDIYQSNALGADKYLVKPVNFDTLIESIKSILA